MKTNVQGTGEQADVYFQACHEPYQVVVLGSDTVGNINLKYEAREKIDMYLKLEDALDEDEEEVFGYQTLGFGASLGMRYSL